MSLVLSNDASLYGGEAEHDGRIREAASSRTYAHNTGFQKNVTPEAQDGRLKPGTVKAMIKAWPFSYSEMNAVEVGMKRLSTEDVDLSFKDKCFLLGDVCQLTATTSGISTALQTIEENSRLQEDHYCAHIQAPEGVVSPGVEVTLHYAVILEGPFKFPKAYRRVSSVLFLHCNDTNQLKKEVKIQLKHWADICGDKESGLCFMKANHKLGSDENQYEFKPVEGGNFEADGSGAIHLKNHFCLLCVAIDHSKGYASDRYYAVLCHKKYQEFRICIVYAVPSWLKAIMQYYWRFSGEDTPTCDYRMFSCLTKDATQRCVDLSTPTLTASGVGWHHIVLESQVDLSVLDKYRDENLNQPQRICTEAVEMSTGVFPPSLKFIITYDDGTADGSLKKKPHKVSLKGCTDAEVSFWIEVFEIPARLPAQDSLKTCASHECSPVEEEGRENVAPLLEGRTKGGKKVVQRGPEDDEPILLLPNGLSSHEGAKSFQEVDIQTPEHETTTTAVAESQGVRTVEQAATSPFSVLKIFESFEEKFIQCVHAKYNVLRLKRKKVIPPDIVTKIESVNDAEAVEILYDHLKHHGTVDTLMEYCEVASEADGYPNMQSLARKMKDLLEGKTQHKNSAPNSYAPNPMPAHPKQIDKSKSGAKV